MCALNEVKGMVVYMKNKEVFYSYDISGLTELMESNLGITRTQYNTMGSYAIAIKRGNQYYDVVSAVPLTTEPDTYDGIGIENVREATKRNIKCIAINTQNSNPSTISEYKETMKKIYERAKKSKQELEDYKRILSRLAEKIDNKL